MAIDYDLTLEIKKRADIVDVISFYIPNIIKKGKRYYCICPFHDDHDPSMTIDKDKQLYKCYVCQSGGDVFSFVRNYDKCSFEEAVKKVAEIIGFDDPRLHKQSYVKKIDDNLIPVYNCITELEKYYTYALSTEEGLIARNYLDNRKISDAQRTKFNLGYAFKDGKMTIQFLQAKGFSLKNIENVGIALASTSNMQDNNQGRLIFPIKDASGQVVGFSARKINDDPEAPKYVNSPETVIFTKGKVLYNFHNAKQTAKHDGYIYLVEGFMDVFALDTIGITSVVALMSTKLTNFHIELLRNLNVEIRLCLDGDKPGQSAMMKIMSQLDEANLKYRLVSKPGEVRDPDEILKESGEEELKMFVNSLVDPFNFALNYYKNISPLGSIDDRMKVIRHFMPMISSIKDKLVQDDYIYKLADATNFSANAIRNNLKDYKQKENVEDNFTIPFEKEQKGMNLVQISKELRRLILAEKTLLQLMLQYGDAIKFYEENVKYFYNENYRLIANFILEEYNNTNNIDVSLLISRIQASEIPNADSLINEISSLTFGKTNIPFSPITMKDCEKVINEERTKIYKKNELKKALEGKTPQEQALIIKEYLGKLES